MKSTLWLKMKELLPHVPEHLQESFENTINVGKTRNKKRDGKGSYRFKDEVTHDAKFVIDYDSIPSQTITKYSIPSKQQFIDQIKAAQSEELQWKQSEIEAMRSELPNAIAEDATVRAWYLDRLQSIAVKTPKLWKRCITDYTRLAAWLKYIAPANRSMARRYGFDNVPDFYAFCRALINKESLHNFSVNNHRAFLRKMEPFKIWLESAAKGDYQEEKQRAALESLISKKFGVTNNTKMTEWHINQLYKLAKSKQLPPKDYADDLNAIARKERKEEVSVETVRLWLRKPEVKTKLAYFQQGHMSWINRNMFIVTRDGASVPDALWWIDGTPEEVWYYDKADKGNPLKRLQVVKVMDDYSECIIGYAFGRENSDNVYRAVKAAVQFKGTIGYQITSDKGPALTSNVIQDWFKVLFANRYGHTPTTTGLARAKVIEPMQAHFRKKMLARDPNHSFGNITSMGDQANPDYIKEHLHEFPTTPEELAAQITRRIEQWNEAKHSTKGASRLSLYEVEYDERPHVNDLLFADVFMLRRPRTVKYSPEGIEFDWVKKNYKFVAPLQITPESTAEDIETVAKFTNENIDRSFEIHFDPDDLNRIALYYNGAFYAWAYNKLRTKRTLFDTDTYHGELLQQYKLVQASQLAQTKEWSKGIDQYADAEGLVKHPFSLGAVHKNDRADADTKLKTVQIDQRNIELEIQRSKEKWG